MTPNKTTSTNVTLRVCSWESRKQSEMRTLIERHGGRATVVASMKEVPLSDNAAAFQFAKKLLAGEIATVIFLTGVGTRALFEAIAARFPRDQVLAAFTPVCTLVRGPKPAQVLREWGVRIDHRAPEPNTWHEILAVIDAQLSVAGTCVAVQEYGQPSTELHDALESRGASVLPVHIYRWALPDDVASLRDAVRATIAGEFDVLLFTSAQQLCNVLAVAQTEGLKDLWQQAAARCVIGSIGPTATETLRAAGLPVDVQPVHPKMGHLVRESLERAPGLLPKSVPRR